MFAEIRRTMLEYHLDRNAAFYKAMELRANDLEAEERLRRTSKEKWKDRGIGILIGVIGTVIGGIILWLILPD